MELCVFSKHLQDLDFDKLGKTVKSLGLDGVDLTVRDKGHVLPEEVKDKLPEAKEKLEAAGVGISMITTGITDINTPMARETLETAGGLGIGYFKLGYYMHKEFGDIRKRMAETAAKLKDIEAACKEYGIKAGLHNHSGPYLGALVPQGLQVMQDCDPEWVGIFFDIGHATIEGAFKGWKLALDEASDRLMMVAVKDLTIRRIDTRAGTEGYPSATLPMGEGLVEWEEFAECLHQTGFDGPLSFHSEYDLPVEGVIKQTEKDLAFFKPMLVKAGFK